jgi:hypothetical protein
MTEDNQVKLKNGCNNFTGGSSGFLMVLLLDIVKEYAPERIVRLREVMETT